MVYLMYSTNTCSSTTTCLTNCIWDNWNNTSTNTSTTSSSNTIWVTWVSDSIVTGTYVIATAPQQRDPEIVAVEEANAAALEAHRSEMEEKARERAKLRETAEVRARELLYEHLSDAQRRALDKYGWFLVEGGLSKKTYRITGKQYSGNIAEIEGDKTIATYCIHAGSDIPLSDQLLAQLLHLKYDENHFHLTANKTLRAA